MLFLTQRLPSYWYLVKKKCTCAGTYKGSIKTALIQNTEVLGSNPSPCILHVKVPLTESEYSAAPKAASLSGECVIGYSL